MDVSAKSPREKPVGMIELNLEFLEQAHKEGYTVFYERDEEAERANEKLGQDFHDSLWNFQVQKPDGSMTDVFPSLQAAINYLHEVLG